MALQPSKFLGVYEGIGGSLGTKGLVDAKEFTWLQGQELLTSYVGKHGFGLQFCSQCGSTLSGIYQGEVHGVTLGCVNGDPDVEIGRHIFVDSKANWEIMPEGVTQYGEAD